jgi:hypothetical protein
MALPAQANTVTFSGIPDNDGGPSQYLEDGIAVESRFGRSIGAFGNAGKAAHMDDGGTFYSRSLEFTMATHFNAVSFDISPLSFISSLTYTDMDDPLNILFFDSVSFENVKLEGFSGGSLKASYVFDMSIYPARSFSTVALSGFNRIDMLRIDILRGSADQFADMPGFKKDLYCDTPCSHYDLDNVVLAPVPLPAGFPLLLTGLAGFAGLLLRKKRKAHV